MEKNYKEYLPHITNFIFDIDGVLTDGSILISSEGDFLRTMNVKDGYAIRVAIEMGYGICIISGGNNLAVKKRLEILGIQEIYLGIYQKKTVLQEYLDKYQIDPKNVLYMGDDLPDIPPMQLVGLPCCPENAVTEVKENSKYISHKKGGAGCVREVIEQVLKSQSKWHIDFSTIL